MWTDACRDIAGKSQLINFWVECDFKSWTYPSPGTSLSLRPSALSWLEKLTNSSPSSSPGGRFFRSLARALRAARSSLFLSSSHFLFPRTGFPDCFLDMALRCGQHRLQCDSWRLHQIDMTAMYTCTLTMKLYNNKMFLISTPRIKQITLLSQCLVSTPSTYINIILSRDRNRNADTNEEGNHSSSACTVICRLTWLAPVM